MGGASLETFSGEAQLKKSPCMYCRVERAVQYKYRFFKNKLLHFPGWQKLREAARGLRRRVWTPTKILSSNILYFVPICTLFGRLSAKKVFFGELETLSWVKKQCFLGNKCTFTRYILHITMNKICKFTITCKQTTNLSQR